MDIIWNKLSKELVKYLKQATKTSSYFGYAHRPNTIDSTRPVVYYLQRVNELDIDILDKNGLNANGNNQPELNINIVIITKPMDATDITLESASNTQEAVEINIRDEIYNYVMVNTDNVNYPLHNCLQRINMSLLPDEYINGSQGQTMSTMSLTIEYSKIGE